MVVGLALSACDAPGRSAAEVRAIRPGEVVEFRSAFFLKTVFRVVTVRTDRGALTVGIGRPVYLTIADDATIRRTIEEGRPGTPMQAFSQRVGGMLTDAQIEILVRGIRSWAKPGLFDHENLPPYASSQAGNTAHGREVFAAACSACHGQDGGGTRTIANSSYLALVTDQHLRTLIIIGMPNLGMPDWRTHSSR